MPFTPHGVIPALVTPLTSEGDVMEQGLRDLIDHVIGRGVHGVFVLGSSGEIYGLSNDQKRQVVEITVDHVAGRVPVYAGASEITTRDCIATAAMADEVGGVDALSVLTPYFMSPSQRELADHYRAIAESTDLPIVLYNNPARTQVDLSLQTILDLAEVENIIGVKDSSGNLSRTADILRERPAGFAVVMGLDTLIFPALVLGADGAIASTGNVAPHVVAGIYEAVKAGDLAKGLELQNALAPLRNLVNHATFPVVLKEALRMTGVEAGYCFAPARELAEPYRSQLREVVEHLESLPV